MAYLSVSAFAADFSNMARDIKKAQENGADYLHVDVMDGNFVPLTGFGTSWIASIRKSLRLPMDVHLMTYNTAQFIPQYLASGINSLLFHVESETPQETVRLLEIVRGHNVRCGLAISPDTDTAVLEPYIPLLDELLVMSTLPGRAGTSFEGKTFGRLLQVRAMRHRQGSNMLISVDGGIDEALAKECVRCGADKVVIGRAFFAEENPSAIAKVIHGCVL